MDFSRYILKKTKKTIITKTIKIMYLINDGKNAGIFAI